MFNFENYLAPVLIYLGGTVAFLGVFLYAGHAAPARARAAVVLLFATALLVLGAAPALPPNLPRATDVLLFLPLLSNRLSIRVKFLFCAMVCAALLVAALPLPFKDDSVARLAFFNACFTAPFAILNGGPAAWRHAVAETVAGYAPAQALFYYRYTPGLILYFSAGFTAALFAALRRYTRIVPRGLDPGAFRVPSWLLIPVVAVPLLIRVLPDHYPARSALEAAWSVAAALIALQGLAGLACAMRGIRARTAVLFMAFAAPLFFVQCFWILGAAGAADLLFGLGFWLEAPREFEPGIANPPAAGSGAALVMVLLAVAAAAVLAGRAGGASGFAEQFIPLDRDIRGDYLIESDPARNRVLFSNEDHEFYVDRYEYPNAAGASPLTGAGPDRARALCQARGRRLCTAREWQTACTSGGRHAYAFPGGMREAIRAADRACGAARGAGGLRIGDNPACRNAAGVHDVMGGVREFVDPGAAGVHGIAGVMGRAARRTNDAYYQCGAAALIFDKQIPALNPAETGFRCCADAVSY